MNTFLFLLSSFAVSSTFSFSMVKGISPPIVYTIAGSDSGGGAGIQADLHAIHAMGCHGCSAITCLTAQNSVGVTSVHSPPPEFLQAQLDTLLDDLPPVAVKIGMLGTKELAIQVGAFLQELRKGKSKVWVVLDPVMISTSGHRLIEEDAQQAMVDHVFPFIDVLTPNKYEAEALLSVKLETVEDVERGAKELLGMGAASVLIKGGHIWKGKDSYAQDYFLSALDSRDELRLCDGTVGVWLRSNRYETEHTHGTGCTLSSAIASALALGERERQMPFRVRRGAMSAIELVDATCLAKAYVTAGIHVGEQLGQGPGPVAQTCFPNTAEYFPQIVKDPQSDGEAFASMKPYVGNEEDLSRLGRILPIVDSIEWVRTLSQRPDIDDIQLRIKDETDENRVKEIIKECQDLCEKSSTRLWVNDHWASAVDAGCYGVHMGQEDLYKCIQKGGIDILRDQKIALGISVHSYAELSVAIGLKPSYVSLGPIYATSSKKVEFDPQGVEFVTKFRNLIPSNVPFVVIGGIGDPQMARLVRLAGADTVAVIGAITNADDMDLAISEFNHAMSR